LSKHFKESVFGQTEDINFEYIFTEYSLSKREQELFVLVAEGKTNEEIADELFISIKTVKHHIYNVFQKMGVKNRLQLINSIRSKSSKNNSI
jgi:DNA-binding CsgD family transcriptional regulator